MCEPGREVAVRDRGDLERQHVPGAARLVEVARPQRLGHREGVWRRQRSQRGHPLGVAPRDDPGDGAAPVVPDDVDRVGSDRVRQRHDVVGHLAQPVCRPPLRPRSWRVAALVGCQGAQAGRMQQRRDPVPAGAIGGEAVQEHDDRAVERPRVGDVEGQPVAFELRQALGAAGGAGCVTGHGRTPSSCRTVVTHPATRTTSVAAVGGTALALGSGIRIGAGVVGPEVAQPGGRRHHADDAQHPT